MAAVKDAVDVCLAVGQVLAGVEEIVVAEVDIMGATVEMVEGEGLEEETAEEGEMAEEEEEEEETAEGVVRFHCGSNWFRRRHSRRERKT